METHELQLIPQPIADGWQGICSCGWKTFESLYYATRDEVVAKIRSAHEAHILDASAPPQAVHPTLLHAEITQCIYKTYLTHTRNRQKAAETTDKVLRLLMQVYESELANTGD